MTKKLPLSTLLEYLAAAREIEARTGALAIHEMMDACGYRSTSAMQSGMDKMTVLGMLNKFPKGQYHTYRVNPEYKQEEEKWEASI